MSNPPNVFRPNTFQPAQLGRIADLLDLLDWVPSDICDGAR
jgi:hypothetical protein